MSDARRTGDTKHKIQAIALELFAEQGYEKTSLREIAERLGVTKAALYYHFKTKEDIVVSLFSDFLGQVDEIIEWANGKAMDAENRKEVLRRYADVLTGSGEALIRFVQGHQSAVHDLKDAAHLFDRFRVLTRLVTDPGASVVSQVRSSVALAILHIGFYGPVEIAGTQEERRAAALEVAMELIVG